MFYPYGAACDGYIVDSDERLRRLLVFARCRFPTTREWVLQFFAALLIAPFLLFAANLLSWPAIVALVAATWAVRRSWSMHRFRGRIAPLVRDLPRVPALAPPVWAPIVRGFPGSLTTTAVTDAFGLAVAAKIREWRRSAR
jgi:hypothetical protein